MKRTLLAAAWAITAVLASPALAEPLPVLQDAQEAFAHHRNSCSTETLLLPVQAALGEDLEANFDNGRLRILYRMAFNQLTEGWNWHPEAKPDSEDYYRYKFLPLKSVTEDRNGYRHEDKIGEPRRMEVRWRYDYFFTFDNLYDFYPRSTDDDAGFSTEVQVGRQDAERLLHGDLRMALRGNLIEQCTSESTTFWKATYTTPVDFTLKKRYLIGKLEEIIYFDRATGQILARLGGKK